MQVAKDAVGETWHRSQIAPNATRLAVGDHEELPLRSMQAQVTIDGFRARVVIDYVFENNLGRQLEGTFQLRLPEEASPYFFAFGENAYAAPDAHPMVIAASETDPVQIMNERAQAWSHPNEARMVPREKAAIAYGATVRRRVDPALVEWSGAGVFDARVFPLAPGKLHRIVVGYDVDLVRNAGQLEYRFDAAPKVPWVADVSIAKPAKVVSIAPAVEPAVDPDRARYHFDNAADRTIVVRTEGTASTLAGHDDIGDVFAAQLVPALPAESAAHGSDSAVFLVDTSLSSNPDRFNIWLKLVRAVLDENRGTLKRFNALMFSVDAHWYRPAFVDNTPENVDAFLAFANQLALEGATDLGAAFAEATHPVWLPQGGRYDLFLLSDGASTWGESNLHALGKTLGTAHPLFAYQTGLAGTDVAALSQLARATGGAVFSVTGESEIAQAATAHRARPWRLVGMALDGASDLLVAGRPTSLFPGQTIVVAGRGAIGERGRLMITVERDGRQEVIAAPLGRPIASRLAPRVYGQLATSQLEELEGATEATSKAYATHFRVTGKTCSLLMLDSEADYARFNIRPEEDALVVKSTPAGELYGKTLAAIFDTLGDPKASFVALLAKLEKTPGANLEIPQAYRLAIQQMPGDAFAVATTPLATQMTTTERVPRDLLAKLAKHDLDYDMLSSESQRRARTSAADALKALSSLVEQSPGDAVLARDVGFSAMELGLRDQAYHLFRRVADARPYEPQTYRAIAQALVAMNKPDLAIAFYEIPLMGQWDQRFGDLRTIVELDYLRFLRDVVHGKLKVSVPDYARARYETLAKSVGMTDADVVVTITWNTDNTDVDLHVTEPSGEECFYGHRRTHSGGELTRDVTQGYGPEMYVLRHAPRGQYQVRAHYFASDRNRASARTKVYVTVYTNWGRSDERASERVVALEYGKEMHDIATLAR
jgi:hypothetical protein